MIPLRSAVRCIASFAPFALLALLLACSNSTNDQPRAPTNDQSASTVVEIAVASRSITAPDTVAPGWRIVRVTEDSGRHIVVMFRLTSGAGVGDVQAFLTALDSGSITPATAAALGGPEIGSVGEVILHVTPGTYVVACIVRDETGHRHAVDGESRVVFAYGVPITEVEPTTTDSIDMSDFAFLRGETWAAGRHVIRIANLGAQDHQLRIQRVKDGMTAQQVLASDDPSALLTGVAGMARMSPGEVSLLPIDLTAGLYIFTCLVADPKTGKPHVELGMFRPVTVQ